MFDFFTDNPVVILVIIFMIVRLLRGNKGKETDNPRQATQKKRSRADRIRELNEAVERQRATARGEMSVTLQDATREAGGRIAGTSATPLSASNDPYAFHSLMNREEQRVADASRTDYDTTAVDYDARSDAFAFRSSSDEPTEKEYHLSGFKGFRPVGGLTTDPVRVSAAGEESGTQEEMDPLQNALSDPDQVRRAIILHEILGRPVSLRRP